MQAQTMQGPRHSLLHPLLRPIFQAGRSLLFVIALMAMTVIPVYSHVAPGGGLVNGSFEDGFVAQEGCRWRSELYNVDVGAGWHCFHNQGAARYGFYADQWAPVVADGSTSQLIEINTWGLQHGDNDRYAGIYQTVKTVPGNAYRLALRGMIRTTGLEGDEWRYRVQVGFLYGASGEWRDVTDWQDVGWDTYYPRTAPGQFSDFQTTFTAPSEQTTIFIRVWKKWGITNEEIDVNLDAISLVKAEK
jgi:hypothetical protein